MNDSDLVQRLGQRDPQAFLTLREHYLPSVWRYVYARVDGDLHVAEDILSDTLVALMEATSDQTAVEIRNPGGWLRTVANRKVQEHFRAAARVMHLIEEAKQESGLDERGDPVTVQEAKEKRQEVRQAMDSLTDQHRMALEWKYIDKLSVREIAERWGATEKAAESVLFRARGELRAKLSKGDIGDQMRESRATEPPPTKQTRDATDVREPRTCPQQQETCD